MRKKFFEFGAAVARVHYARTPERPYLIVGKQLSMNDMRHGGGPGAGSGSRNNAAITRTLGRTGTRAPPVLLCVDECDDASGRQTSPVTTASYPVAKKRLAKKSKSSAPRNAGADRTRPVWSCRQCGRSFTQENQRHACGTGDRSEILRNRPDAVVRAYAAVERFAESLGPIEIVARERYALFRSVRIFADLVIMTDALRVAVHLPRRSDDPIFFKVVRGNKKVTHVAKVRSVKDVGPIQPYLKEAYDFSLGHEAQRT
jgi:hypothetical protein